MTEPAPATTGHFAIYTGRATNWTAIGISAALAVPLFILSASPRQSWLEATALLVYAVGVALYVLTGSSVRTPPGPNGVSVHLGALGWPRCTYRLDQIHRAEVVDLRPPLRQLRVLVDTTDHLLHRPLGPFLAAAPARRPQGHRHGTGAPCSGDSGQRGEDRPAVSGGRPEPGASPISRVLDVTAPGPRASTSAVLAGRRSRAARAREPSVAWGSGSSRWARARRWRLPCSGS